MKKLRWLLASLALLGLPLESLALDPRDYTIAITAQAQSSPPQIRLQWPERQVARQYVIRRKTVSDGSWSGPIATLPGNATSFTDTQVSAGTGYEYEIEAPTSFYPWPNGDSSKWVTAWAYIQSGIEIPIRDYMGKVLLLVDAEVAGALANELQVFTTDLIGAGWQVIRRDVQRNTPVNQVRSLVQSEYNADPGNVRSVILFGHIPVPYSGAINPDMHLGHFGAWPADVVYADVNGNYTDHSVNISNSEVPANNNVPGDGKFDQSTIPSDVELEIGRIDMWNLPAFSGRSEIDLLRRYLQKNHAFRHREFTAVRRALVRDNFGDLDGDAPAVDAWRLFPSMLGNNMINVVGPGDFFPRLNSDTYLWAYGGGGGGYDKADGVGSTDDFAANDPKAVFYILHGSYFGDFDNQNNFLRAATAVQNYGLASIWSGLPHWFMHHLSMGQTLGYSTRVTQNNRNRLYKSHLNFSPGQVHIGLIGDPTLQMFPVAPPSNISANVGVGLALSWNPSPDQPMGYHIYYSQNQHGPYQRLSSTPVSGTTFTQRTLSYGTHYYMVRAIKLETTPSGSFYQASQGAFIKVVNDSTGPQLPVITLTIDDGDAGEAGQKQARLRLTRNQVTPENLVINLDISGTAQNGVDYQSTPGSVVIEAGTAVAFLNITPIQDAAQEGDENVQIFIKASSAYSVGNPASANIIIKDNHVNQPPALSAIADQVIDQNSATANIAFTVSDVETAAGNLQVAASSSNQALAPNGNITLGGSGNNRTIQIVPAPNQTGNSSITVTVSDGALTAQRTFNLTVRAINRAPIANNQSVQLLEDEELNILLAGSDPDGNNITYSIVAHPQKGALTGSAPNIVYKANPNINGSDSFTFRVSDGALASEVATVQIAIAPVNDGPTASSQSLTLDEDTVKNITLAGADIDGDALTFILKSQPGKGALSGAAPNLIYTPSPNATGNDVFTFVVTDGKAESAPAVISMQITPINDLPVAKSQSIELLEDTSKAVVLAGSDPDGDALTYQIKTSPQKGTLSGVPPNLIYKANTNASGQDTFTFTVKDATEESTAATITINIVPLNDAPTISGLADVQIAKGSTGSITVRLNDPDTLDSSLTLTGTSSNQQLLPNSGISFEGTGQSRTMALKPIATAVGLTTITITVSDGEKSASVTFMLSVLDTHRRISSIELSPTGVATIRFQGTPRAWYQLHATSTSPGEWIVVAEGRSDDEGNAQEIDNEAKNIPFRIYRVEWR